MNILLMMSGSIAAAKTTGLISLWRKAGHEVKVACTHSVFEFIGKATLEGLSDHSVVTSVFEEDNMMDHIHLSRWADIIVLAPATANTINKLVAGIADDIVTTSWVAALELGKPLYLAPAMNSMMWNYPATQNSIKQLQNWGVKVLLPQSGDLACGEKGAGRLMEIEAINQAILKIKQNKHVLITAGGTREYIDGVRYIGNSSSGKTGAAIADFFTTQGYNVTWLGAKYAQQPLFKCNKIFYDTFSDLQSLLKKQLSSINFTTVIHAAAVSDYSITNVRLNDINCIPNKNIKLPTSDKMSIQLSKNPKLIKQLRNWSINKSIKVIAFKLTNTNDNNLRQSAINKLIKHKSIDYVAHNDLTEINQQQHAFNFYKSNTLIKTCTNTTELCELIQEKTA